MTAYSTPDDSFGTSAANAVTFLAGVWLIVSPFVLTHATGRAYWNDVTIGIVVSLLAAVRAIAQRDLPWLAAITAVVGGWLIVAPWALGYSTSAATVNDMLVGVVMAVAAAIGAALTYRRRARTHDEARRAGRRSAAEAE